MVNVVRVTLLADPVGVAEVVAEASPAAVTVTLALDGVTTAGGVVVEATEVGVVRGRVVLELLDDNDDDDDDDDENDEEDEEVVVEELELVLVCVSELRIPLRPRGSLAADDDAW